MDDSENKSIQTRVTLPSKKPHLQKIWLILLTLAIIGLVAYAMTTARKLKEVNQALISQISPLKPKIELLQKESQTHQENLNSINAELPTFHQKLVLLTQNEAWILAEAHYLVFLAKERLDLTQNTNLAKTQLEAAANHLKTLPDEKFASLKLALAKDIVALSSRPPVERESLWHDVEILKSSFPKLTFKTLDEPLKTNEAPLANYPTMRKILSPFQGVMKVSREEDNPIPQALDILEKAQLLRVLALMADQTQWAILQGQDKIYQDSLEELKKISTAYFAQDEHLQNLLDQINKLLLQSPNITLPDISASLGALERAQADLKSKQQERGGENDTTH